MKLLFKQRFASWLGSYEVYSESGEVLYRVRGKVAWGHCFRVFDAEENEIGLIKQKLMSWVPCFEIYNGGVLCGRIRKEMTFFKPRFNIDYMGWSVKGSFSEWNYRIYNDVGLLVAEVKKEIFKWTDTYAIDVLDPNDAFSALMLVVAIDAEKSMRNS